jgi:hypothetical protein
MNAFFNAIAAVARDSRSDARARVERRDERDERS